MGTGEGTLALFLGVAIVNGKAHSAAGGGSVAGGTTVVLVGGVGVTEQLATFAGRPWHPASIANTGANSTDPVIRAVRWLRQQQALLRISRPLEC